MVILAAFFCNLLLITAFGLQDTITNLADLHYHVAIQYDAEAILEGPVGKAETYTRRIPGKVECIMTFPVSLQTDADRKIINLTVLQNNQNMVRLGENGTFLSLPDGTAAITRKISETMDVYPGDVITVLPGGTRHPIQLSVGCIADSIFNQGIYLNRKTWESLHAGAFEPSSILLSGTDPEALKALRSMKEVQRIERPEIQMQQTLEVLTLLSAIFTLMTVIALLLELAINYNIGLINYMERVREYAVLKVQGFRQKELRHLILTENGILSAAGLLLGIKPGLFLTDFMIRFCESETERYFGMVNSSSILAACLITFIFSLLVQLIHTVRVRHLQMTEALRSVE